MTLTFDIDGLAARLPELLAEIEAGHEILIARGAKPVARVKKEPEHPNREGVEAAIAEIRARRRQLPPTTLDEILQWRDEDRR